MSSTVVTTFATAIPVQYRDADNFKRHGQLVVGGIMTDAQVDELAALLDKRIFFCPEDVGMPHLLDASDWSRNDEDHAWHELDLADRSPLENADPETLTFTHPGIMIDVFRAASKAGWPSQHVDAG